MIARLGIWLYYQMPIVMNYQNMKSVHSTSKDGTHTGLHFLELGLS